MSRRNDTLTLALEARGLKKRFGGTEALKGVDLDVSRGRVVALVGENGAGKSTLVRIVSGEIEADEGTVDIAGQPLTEATPAAAAGLGVGVIHQELSFVGQMSVAENLFLTRLPRRSLLRVVDRTRLHGMAREALREIGPHIDVRKRMDDIRVGDRQIVEIERAVATGASLILMDEPTAALNADEVGRLFEVVRNLKDRGVGVLYISHRLDEIAQVADEVVVLRDGDRVASHAVGEVSREQLVREIVGRELRQFFAEAPPAEPEEDRQVRLELDGIGVPGALEPLSLAVHRGEIVGLYGLAGSGVEIVAYAIAGAIRATGDVVVDGRRLHRRTPAICRKAGLALVPADRRAEGLFPLLPVATNVEISRYGEQGSLTPVTRGRERNAARRWIDALDVRPRNPDLPIGALSGGNQQKAVFARWLATDPSAFVLDQPTRGIDVGAKSQMYELIEDLAGRGAANLVISPDLAELMVLSARIGVVSRGRLVGTFPTRSTTEEEIVDLAIGGHVA